MPFDTSGLFEASQFISIIKIGTLIALAIYIVFAFVIFTQVKVMNRILKQTSASTVVMLIASTNVVFSILLFIISLVVL